MLKYIPAHAENTSPFSILYTPDQGQIISTSSTGYYETNFKIRSAFINDDGKSRYGLISQSIDYGVTNQITISISETYAQAFQHNPLNPSEGRVGFRAPKFQATWLNPIYEDQILFKSIFGFQVNPGTSSNLNYYLISGDLIFKSHLNPQILFGTGLTQTEHKDIDSRSQTWQSEIGIDLNPTYIKYKYGRSRLAEVPNQLGKYDPSWYSTQTTEIGQKINPKLWIGLSYLYEKNPSHFVQNITYLPVTMNRRHHLTTLSIKWAIDPLKN